jgi:hypothetical protein
MAESLKTLSRAVPGLGGANAAITAYTVPTSTQTVISSIIVANTAATAATYRLFAVGPGAAVALGTALFYDVPLAGNSSAVLQVGITLAAGEGIAVASSTTTVTFTMFGQEIR